jgi:hypothetical protein
MLEDLKLGLVWESLDGEVFRMSFHGEGQHQVQQDGITDGFMD